MKKKLLIIVSAVSAVLLLSCLLFCKYSDVKSNEVTENMKRDYIAYFEKTIGISIIDCVDSAEGEIKKTLREEYAYIRLKIKPDMYMSVLDKLSGFHEYSNTESFKIPGYSNHSIAQALKKENLQKIYMCFPSGKKAKTRSIEIYVTQDADGNYYVYMMG